MIICASSFHTTPSKYSAVICFSIPTNSRTILVIVTANIVSSVLRSLIDFNVSTVSINSDTRFVGNSKVSIISNTSLSLSHSIATPINALKSCDNSAPVNWPLKNEKSYPKSAAILKPYSKPTGINAWSILESKINVSNVSISV